MPVPVHGAALMLHLSYLRSSQVVARAVAERFPDRDSWLEFLRGDLAHDTFEQFAQLVRHIQSTIDAGQAISFEQLTKVGASHYEAGLEAVMELAAELDVPPDDLLTTLLYG